MGNLDSGFLLPYSWLPLFNQLETAEEKWETLSALIDRQRYGRDFPPFDEDSLQFSICSAFENTIASRLNGSKGGQKRSEMQQNEKPLSSGLDKGASEANKSKSKSKSKIKDIYSAEIRTVIEYLNEKARTKYRYSGDSTKRHIHARLEEGYSVDDFKAVIDKKCDEWLGDEKMAKYLCPETLFGTKFEKYLNQPRNSSIIGAGDNDDLPY